MRLHLTKKERREREQFRNALSMSFANASDVALLSIDFEADEYDTREYERTLERERMSAE